MRPIRSTAGSIVTVLLGALTLAACSAGKADSGASDEGALRYDVTSAACTFSMEYESISSPQEKKLSNLISFETRVTAAAATLDDITAEGWQCGPANVQTQCGGVSARACSRGTDKLYLSSCAIDNPDQRVVIMAGNTVMYTYRVDMPIKDQIPSSGPGEQALRNAFAKTTANLKVGYLASDRSGLFPQIDIELDQDSTNALVREYGGTLGANTKLPAFEPLKLDWNGNSPIRGCAQSHLPSSVEDGASFHLCVDCTAGAR